MKGRGNRKTGPIPSLLHQGGRSERGKKGDRKNHPINKQNRGRGELGLSGGSTGLNSYHQGGRAKKKRREKPRGKPNGAPPSYSRDGRWKEGERIPKDFSREGEEGMVYLADGVQ